MTAAFPVLPAVRGRRRPGASARWLWLAGGLAAACARRATAAECTALLDRYVELLVREQDPQVGDVEIARQKSLTHDKAAQDSAFASCPSEVTARAVHCAMAAPNVDEFEKCLE